MSDGLVNWRTARTGHVSVVGEGSKIERVADPEAHPILPRDNGREDELGHVEVQEEGEEGVGVHVESIGPAEVKMISRTENGCAPFDLLIGRMRM